MEKIVSFTNPGLIDPRVWSTFGVSVKETDTAIGQFGTGLKYAIAVLMREGRSLTIKSGDNNYEFTVESVDIRGKEFQQIFCNGDPLPFTTHLGSKWELWMAYRELYSNCLDEGGCIGDDMETVIHAEIGDIAHSDVFLSKKNPIAESHGCDVFQGRSDWVYYKGIRATKLNNPTLFTYNIKDASLTEDRTIKYEYQIHTAILDCVYLNDGSAFSEDFLFKTQDWYEGSVNSAFTQAEEPGQSLVSLINKYRKDGVYMQKAVLSASIKKLGAAIYESSEMDSRQSRVVEKAKNFCREIGYSIDYDVVMSKDLGASTLGMADTRSETIYLSDRVIDQGVKQVASTLIEENLHIAKRFQDCTYEMQSYLFDQIVTMGERLTGDIL